MLVHSVNGYHLSSVTGTKAVPLKVQYKTPNNENLSIAVTAAIPPTTLEDPKGT